MGEIVLSLFESLKTMQVSVLGFDFTLYGFIVTFCIVCIVIDVIFLFIKGGD